MGDLQPDETNLLNNNLSQVSITENSAEIFSNANQLPLETVSQNSIGHRNCNTIRCPATQQKMWATNGRICYRFNGFCHMIKENCRRRNRNQRILQPSTRRICRHQKSQLSKSENLSSN
ncbi:uncharacterized protein LOC115621751 [Scaptodrosophila lebanonensis]|uniref:Uncharacterized protein LOC115621751 n=1 Tax=Drosophila lebanonensis TaxID=7225 RepID=A0A6J2T7V3_DROLE|nr:uncharacterized protein LOC115621751 [Scaptodrosophila lebanonensis]